MLERDMQLLAPPVFQGDEEKTRISSEINLLGWLLPLLSIAGAITYWILIPSIVALVILSLVVFTLLAEQVLLHRGHVRQASLLFISVIGFTFNGSAFFTGGAHLLGFSANVLVVLGARLWL